MLGVILFVFLLSTSGGGTWFELRFGPALSYISMSQYNECAKDANDSYAKYEWQDTTLKVFGRIGDWNSAVGFLYPEVIRGARYKKKGCDVVVGIGLGMNPVFSSTNSIVSSGYIREDTIYCYWRRKLSYRLHSIPLILSPRIDIEGKRFKILMRVGVGWYPALLYSDLESYSFEQPPEPEGFKWSNLVSNASFSSTNGFGWDGEFGFGYSPFDFVTVSFGFMGRMAKIIGFEGSYEQDWDGVKSSGDCVIAYHYDEKEGIHHWGGTPKEEFEAKGYEKGSVDLNGTGLFFRLSLRIR